MTTLTTVPARPIAGREAKLTFTLTNGAATFVKVWVTSAPEGSDEAAKLADSTEDRWLFYQGAGTSTDQKDITFTVAGTYNFVAQEYNKGASAHGGTHADDPNSFQSETAIPPEYNISLAVGQKVSLRLGAADGNAKLVFYVWTDTVYATTAEDHGEVTPAVIEPSSPKARAAALESNLVTVLAALAGQTVAAIVGNPNTSLDNISTKWNLHLANTGGAFHNAADADNLVDDSFIGSAGNPALVASGRNLAQLVDFHYRNAKASDTATGSSPYHAPSGTAQADFVNNLIAGSAGDALTAVSQVADIWRSYTAHIANTGSHSVADTTNTLTALPALMNIMRYFFDSLSQQNPTAPATEQSGVVQLVQTYGATEE